MIEFDKSLIRSYCNQTGIPIIEPIMQLISSGTKKGRSNSTLLAVCLNTEAVLKASLIAVELISYVEGVRRRNKLPRTSYEIGTEEVHGGFADINYVSNPEAYPAAGMVAANIGPEFTAEEYKGLMERTEIESRLFKSGKLECSSGFKTVLKEVVVESCTQKDS